MVIQIEIILKYGMLLNQYKFYSHLLYGSLQKKAQTKNI